jgi:transposase
MVWEKYGVRLEPEQRDRLEHVVRAGKSSARVTTRARILLKTDDGWSAPQVAQALDVVEGTVYRIKRRFAEAGVEGVLRDRTQAHRYRKLDDRGEAHLIALACSPAPEGHAHWTLRLLAGKVVELGLAPALSHETVRQRLKKRELYT